MNVLRRAAHPAARRELPEKSAARELVYREVRKYLWVV
jgi:hypothetical protein